MSRSSPLRRSMFSTLVNPERLCQHLNAPRWVIVDCRFDLHDVNAGLTAYLAGHIPGAVYAHLDYDLSGPPVTDRGRHPMPTPEALIALFRRLGIHHDSQVVVYDTADGGMAGRLWWLLRYMGHAAVAVLDGGWHAWLESGGPAVAGSQRRAATTYHGEPRRELLVTVEEVPSVPLLIDSRAPERYRGELEPFDPVAGHIPGALNHWYGNNVDVLGRFLPEAQLRGQLETVLRGVPGELVTFYCGSGVNACQNLLAMVHAGFPLGRLYAGSWSDWCSDSTRPVATGPDP